MEETSELPESIRHMLRERKKQTLKTPKASRPTFLKSQLLQFKCFQESKTKNFNQKFAAVGFVGVKKQNKTPEQTSSEDWKRPHEGTEKAGILRDWHKNAVSKKV